MSASEHPYHRSLAPMMWVFVGLASTELLIVHFLVALWDWRVALILSLLSLSGIFWIMRAIHSFRRMPVMIGDDRILRMHAGHFAGVAVPLDEIAAIRSHWDGEELKRRDVLNLALISYPNVLIDLRTPIARRRRAIRSVAHRLDAPAAFREALGAAMNAGRQVERMA